MEVWKPRRVKERKKEIKKKNRMKRHNNGNGE